MKKQFNLSMSDRTQDIISNIQERTDSSSVSEVIRKALACYDLISKEIVDNQSNIYIERAGEESRQIEFIL